MACIIKDHYELQRSNSQDNELFEHYTPNTNTANSKDPTTRIKMVQKHEGSVISHIVHSCDTCGVTDASWNSVSISKPMDTSNKATSNKRILVDLSTDLPCTLPLTETGPILDEEKYNTSTCKQPTCMSKNCNELDLQRNNLHNNELPEPASPGEGTETGGSEAGTSASNADCANAAATRLNGLQLSTQIGKLNLDRLGSTAIGGAVPWQIIGDLIGVTDLVSNIDHCYTTTATIATATITTDNEMMWEHRDFSTSHDSHNYNTYGNFNASCNCAFISSKPLPVDTSNITDTNNQEMLSELSADSPYTLPLNLYSEKPSEIVRNM